MTSARKRDEQPQPRLFPFIIVWTLACSLASGFVLIMFNALGLLGSLNIAIWFLLLVFGFFPAVAAVQFFVIRQFLRVELRGWIPLSLVGAFVGALGAMFFFAGATTAWSERLFLGIFFLLLWGTPAAFQWFLLRQRFVNHALWLLAAVVTGPVFGFIVTSDEAGNILFALLPNVGPLLYVPTVIAAGLALPFMVQGLALFVVVKLSGNPNSVDQAAS